MISGEEEMFDLRSQAFPWQGGEALYDKAVTFPEKVT